ncbi:MAG: STAS domain-containing protein [Methylomicrobium sp.]
MNLTQQQIDGVSVLSIDEERIDAHNSGDLKAFLLERIEEGDTHIVVQLQQVKFIDSSGLGALLAGFKHAAAKSGKLSLAAMQPQVLSMFELTRLNRVFEIYGDLDEATASES